VAEQLETIQQLYTPGTDIAVGFESTQLVWGRTGNDVILGFQPVVPNPFIPQLDIMIGDVEINDLRFRQWRDTFILGDWQRPYYANGLLFNGITDFAVIADFNPALDQVQLFGNASNYLLIPENNNTILAIQKPTGVDVVAYFLNTPNLNLNAPYFQYKGNTAPPIAIPQAKQVGTAGFDILVRNAVDNAGNVILAGGSNGSLAAANNNNSRDAVIVKYNAQGAELWRRQFGTSRFDTIYDVGTDAQGNIYVAGATFGNLAAQKEGISSDIFIAKLTPAGQTLWTRQFGSPTVPTIDNINTPFALDVDASGSVFVTGVSTRSDGPTVIDVTDDFWVTKYDTNGARQWFTEYGTPALPNSLDDFDEPYAVTVSNDGSVYAAGWTFGNFGGTNQGAYDVVISKLNPQGQVQWVKQLGTSDYEWIWGLDTDSQGNVYAGGWTLGSLGGANAGSYDAFITKYNSSGDRLWTRQLGSTGDDQLFALEVSANNQIFVAGYTDGNLGGTNAGNYDVWAASYDINGNRSWLRQFGTPELDQANAISADNQGNVFISGITQGSLGGSNAGSFDSYVAKLNAATGATLSFGTPAANTGARSTFLASTATPPSSAVTQQIRSFFTTFSPTLNLPTGSGGASGRNLLNILRSPILTPLSGWNLTQITSLITNSLLSPAPLRTSRSAASQKTLSNGNNVFQGSEANDAVNGQGGRDKLAGMGGSDRLKGGAGSDRIIGGQGDDWLVGGEGADTFVLSQQGTDQIMDFDWNEGDRFILPGRTDELRIVQGSGLNAQDTLVQRGEDVLAILIGVQASQIPFG
jgi:hypothetical protein